jgi:predicted ATPase
LGSAEVGHFLAGAPTPARDGLVSAIHKATGGNPFFVTEVVRLWLTDGTARQENPDAGTFQVPEEVREAIRRRLAPLSANAATLLALAAVIGREFDTSLLEQVAGLGASFAEPLAEAMASGLIEEGPHGRYGFAHALVRQTMYGDQSPSRRVALHRAVAEGPRSTVSRLRIIGEANPSLRRYLAGTIKTGQFCSYTPDPRFPVAWRLE